MGELEELHRRCERAELALSVANERLRTMSRRVEMNGHSGEVLFHAVFEGALDAILLADDSSKYIDANPAACELFGLPRSELLGRTIMDFAAPGYEAGDEWKSFAARGHLSGKFPLLRPDGTQRDLEFNAVANILPGVHLSVLRDITHESRAEAARQERQLFEQQLLGIVSHDLRGPISAILMTAHVLLNREDLDERTLKAAARVYSSATRASRMLEDLLDFTRMRIGQGLVLRRSPANLHDIVAQVVEEARAALPDRPLLLERSGDARGDLDVGRVEQIVQNLVSNALKYGRVGTPVRIRSSGSETMLEVSVWNEGEPIAPEFLPRLFEPMQRGSVGPDSRSIGLGLYIVDAIVRAHDGTIDVSSSAEAGTTFTVRLPRHKAS